MSAFDVLLNGGIVLILSLLLFALARLLRLIDERVEATQLESSRRLLAGTREKAEARRRVADEATESVVESEA